MALAEISRTERGRGQRILLGIHVRRAGAVYKFTLVAESQVVIAARAGGLDARHPFRVTLAAPQRVRVYPVV